MKTRITSAFVLEGNAYEVACEDGIGTSFDCQVGVETVDGRRLVHRTFISLGKGSAEEDGYRFNYVARSRDAAQRFANKVSAVGFINEALWFEMEEPESLESRWARYAMEEERERRGIYSL